MDAVKKVAILKVIVENLNAKMMHMALDVTKNVNVFPIHMMELVVNLEDNAQVANLDILERIVVQDVIINVKQNYAVYLKNIQTKKKLN
jgi:hypothetical protein